MSDSGMRYQEYKCVRCGDTDTPKFFEAERMPEALNCNKCGSKVESGGGMWPNGEPRMSRDDQAALEKMAG